MVSGQMTKRYRELAFTITDRATRGSLSTGNVDAESIDMPTGIGIKGSG